MSAYPLTITETIVGGKVVKRQSEVSQTLPTATVPLVANTDYRLPILTGYYFDLRTWKTKLFMVYADQAVTVQVEDSLDGSTFYDVEGYGITSANFVTGKWNTILTDIPLHFSRLKVTTGSTPPTSLIMVVRLSV